MFWNFLTGLRKKRRVRLVHREGQVRRFRPFLELLEKRELFSGSPTMTAISPTADPAAPGQSVTFAATVSSTGGTPTGIVTFEDGTAVLGTATLTSDVSGAVASFTTSSLATGFHSIIAVYGGDGAFIGSSSASLSEAVEPVTTATSLSSSAAPAAPGQALTFTAIVSSVNGGTPTGSVSFLDGTTVLGTATLTATASGAQTSFTTSGLALGSHSITAVYGGASTFSASTSACLSETIQKVQTFAALSSSSDPVPLGQSLTLTAMVSGANGGTPTGTITFKDGTTILGTSTLSAGSAGVQATFSTSSLAAGPHTISAVYSGDTTFAGGSAFLTQIVGQSTATSSSTSLVSSTSQAAPGEAVTFTAAVFGAGGGTPTGMVTFLDGSTVLDTAVLSATSSGAQASFTTSALAKGTHTITALYSGDSTFAASASASLSVPVQMVSTFVSLTSSANPASPGQADTLTATVSGADGGTSTGTVTFLDGSTVLGTAPLIASSSGVQATFTTSSLANGMHALIAEYGGDSTYVSGSSPTFGQAVQFVDTSTSVTTSVDPALVGQSVTLTAAITSENAGTPTGTVTLLNGTTVLGTATLSAATSGAEASLTASGLAVGANGITAVYSGDSTFAGSTSASLDESVQQIVSYTALSSSIAVSSSGQPVTFTATVVGATGGTPTGTVTFRDGNTALGTVSVSAASGGAQATYTTSALSNGTHVITALYSGDSTLLTSTASLSQDVGQSWAASTTTTVSSSLDPAAPGQAVTFTATITSTGSSSTPTGMVAFMDGSSLVGTAVVTAATTGGEASFTTASLAASSHSIIAVYGGDGTFAGSSSSPLSLPVQQIGTSTALTASADPASPGFPVTFTASVSAADGSMPAGTVTFLDGTTVLGTVTLSAIAAATQAVFTTSAARPAARRSITALYSGNITYAGSSSIALSEPVQQLGSYSSVSLSANSSVRGQSVTITATLVGADGGTPTGTVTFKDGSTVLGTATLSPASTGAQAAITTSTLAAGSHSITAVYSGSSGDTGSTSVAVNETVQLLGSITSLFTSTDFTSPGQTVTFTATVVGVGMTAGTPTGSVTFLDGTTVLGTGTLSAGSSGMPGAQASFTTTGLAQGSHDLTAVYGGDATFSRSSGSLSEVVGQGTAAGSSTTLSYSTAWAAPSQAITITATVTGTGGTPTGTVTFLDGSTVLGAATLSPSLGASQSQALFTTTTLGVGMHAITAVYGGDATFSSSASASINETVGLAITSTSLSSSDDSPTAGQPLTFTAMVSGPGSVTPTGTVTFLDGSTVLGTAAVSPDVAGAEASFTTSALAVGFHFITALYSGDSSFAASTSDSLSQTVQKDVAAASLSSSVNPAAPGQSVTFTANVSSPDGTPTGTVTFLDGTTVLGTTTLGAASSGAQAAFTISSLADGNHSITAVYSGDAVFAATTSASLNETVQALGSFTILTLPVNPAPAGHSVTMNVTVSGAGGGIPTGTVTFEDGTTVLGTATLSAGSSAAQATFTAAAMATGWHNITAVYGGDSTYTGSSISVTQWIGYVQVKNTSVTIYDGYNAATVGQPVSFQAAITSSAGGTPTGILLFEDGGVVLGTATLSPSAASGAVATFTTAGLALGSHTITAIYPGDSNYVGSSSSSTSVTVQLGATSTTLETSTDTAVPGDAVTFTATVTPTGNGTPTGTVTFLDGSTVLGTATLNPSTPYAQATFTTSVLAVGPHNITAVYNGDSAFAGSTSSACRRDGAARCLGRFTFRLD